jgi:hypothetical protein
MAKKPKRTPKKKLSKKAQSERFIETARSVGADETGRFFEQTFRKIVPSRTRDKNRNTLK